jgi:hypothetical protein
LSGIKKYIQHFQNNKPNFKINIKTLNPHFPQQLIIVLAGIDKKQSEYNSAAARRSIEKSTFELMLLYK